MVFCRRSNQPQRALAGMLAMVVDPGFAEHLPSEALREFFVVGVPAVGVIGTVFRNAEGMRRRAHSHHRLASAKIAVDLLHLLVGQIAKPRGNHHQVSRAQRLKPRNIVVLVGIDLPGRRIDRIEHRGLEAMMAGQNLGQLREPLLAAVFLIAADEHNLLACPRLARIQLSRFFHDEPGIGRHHWAHADHRQDSEAQGNGERSNPRQQLPVHEIPLKW